VCEEPVDPLCLEFEDSLAEVRLDGLRRRIVPMRYRF
jgi:hypothetical protein